MAKCTLKDKSLIEDFTMPYITAEVNTSHRGNINIAKNMILKAKECGCNCVKFQSWSAESINSKNYYKENPIIKRMFSKFSFSADELSELCLYACEVGISFSSTPYSRQEVDFLAEKANAPFIKISSMEISNYLFLEYIAKTGVPIVLSTGMSDMDEVKTAVEIIENAGGTQLCLLHCISIYPPEMDTINLNNIIGLREVFPQYPIGFSDHSLGIEIAPAAVALGAAFIEKHFTLDKSKMGMDNQMALEPDEMAQMVNNCKNVCMAMGVKGRVVSGTEMEQRDKMRRSVVYTRDIKAGEVLTVKDLDAKRPGTGLHPRQINELIGKVLAKDVEADALAVANDVKIL